jgi:hypothetical protein
MKHVLLADVPIGDRFTWICGCWFQKTPKRSFGLRGPGYRVLSTCEHHTREEWEQQFKRGGYYTLRLRGADAVAVPDEFQKLVIESFR